MSVIMTMWLRADPAKVEVVGAQHAETVQGEPGVNFWHAMDTPDRFGWDA